MSAVSATTTATTASTVATAATAEPAAPIKLHQPSKFDEAKSNFHEVKAHARSSINALGDKPATMRCGQCSVEMTIPPSVWTVPSAGTATGSNVKALLCSHCHGITPVPSSQAAAVFHDAGASIKAGIHSLIDRPKTFHCSTCNAALLAPVGLWECQSCAKINDETNGQCARCQQSKQHQRVLCGHCKQNTTVPASGLSDTMASGLNAFTTMAKKGLLDLTGKPHIACPMCQRAVELPKTLAVTTASNTSSATSSSAAATYTAPVASLPPATATGIPVNEHPVALTCNNCQHRFTTNGPITRPSVDEGLTSTLTGTTITGASAGTVMNMPIAVVAPDPI